MRYATHKKNVNVKCQLSIVNSTNRQCCVDIALRTTATLTLLVPLLVFL